MKCRSMLLAALVLGLFLPRPAIAAPGDPDPTFGSGGTAGTTIATVPNAWATDLALWPDGSILAFGVAGDVWSPPLAPLFVRFLSDGTLDASFGSGGVVIGTGAIGLLGDGSVERVVADPAGGFFTVGSGLEFRRYLHDGTLDASFGTAGVVDLSCGGRVAGLVRTGDGALVSASSDGDGVCLARVGADGTPDPTFGTNGLVETLPGLDAVALAVRSDGKPVLLVSAALASPALARFDPDGTRDEDFGTDGIASVDIVPGVPFIAQALALHPDGRAIVTGWGAAARLDDDGDPDGTFDEDGVALLLGGDLQSNAVLVQPDGKSLALGVGENDAPHAVRIHPNGDPDATFGSGGAALGFGAETLTRVIAQPDGKVLVVGFTVQASNVFLNSVAVQRFESLTIPCADAPASGCNAILAPRAGRLGIDDGSTPAKDKLQLKWQRGGATTLVDIGDPLTTDGQTFCLYDESGATPALIVAATVEVGGVCKKGKPCWRAKGSSGFDFRDRERHRFGIESLKLKAGAAGKSKIILKGKGASLPTPPLPLPLPVRAQILSDTGACWEAVFSATGATRNDSGRFRGKSD